jgi:hypothetical protein
MATKAQQATEELRSLNDRRLQRSCGTCVWYTAHSWQHWCAICSWQPTHYVCRSWVAEDSDAG